MNTQEKPRVTKISVSSEMIKAAHGRSAEAFAEVIAGARATSQAPSPPLVQVIG
jgi:hypothetical protein